MAPASVPDGLDATTTVRVLRSFLVVRLVRGGLLLLFLAIAMVGVELRGWPRGVLVAIGLVMLAQATALVVWWRRYGRAGQRRGSANGPT